MVLDVSAHHGPWTVDDLPDDDRRYEIVDGVLLVTPPAAPRHDLVVKRLSRILDDAIGENLVRSEAGLTFRPIDYRVPDVVVLRPGFDAWNAPATTAADVQLAVEVVSPGSVRTDLVAKLHQYAAEGIGAYWIVQTEPTLTLTAYALPSGSDAYTRIGHWTEPDTVELGEPFDVRFALTDLRDP